MVEIINPKKNIIFDATFFTSLEACGRFTNFRFGLNLVPIKGKSNSLRMGSIVHSILEEYYKALTNGSTRNDAIDAGYKAGKEFSMQEGNDVSDADMETIHNTMEQYFDFYKNDAWVTINVEHVKQVLLYEDDDMRIIWKAKLDWEVDTNNGIYPVDHKTMSQRRDTLSLNNQFMGQCIVMGTRAMIINKIGFQKTLKPIDKFTRPLMSYSLDRLTEWSQVIVPYYARMLLFYNETGYWPPNYTHCENKWGNCPFADICAADTTMREEELRLQFKVGEPWDVTNEPE